MTRATRLCTMQPWGEAGRPGGAGPQCRQWAQHHSASSPVRNQPEAARLLLSAGCQANALNSARSAALHVAVQRGFLEVVQVLCELGCDVNLPVSAECWVPWSHPWGQGGLLPSDHWPSFDRMPTLTRPCTVPSLRARVPVALWRSSLRCQALTSLPPTARASPCCTTRPSRATHCEFGVGTQPGQAPATLETPSAQTHPPAPTERSGGFWLGHGSWWTPRRKTASPQCTWPPSTTTGRWPRFSSKRCGHRVPAGPGVGVRAHQGPRLSLCPPPPGPL